VFQLWCYGTGQCGHAVAGQRIRRAGLGDGSVVGSVELDVVGERWAFRESGQFGDVIGALRIPPLHASGWGGPDRRFSRPRGDPDMLPSLSRYRLT